MAIPHDPLHQGGGTGTPAAAPGRDDVPVQGRDQPGALRQPCRLGFPEPRGRLQGRSPDQRRSQGRAQRHGSSLGHRRQRCLGLEELPAGAQPAVHGPVRRQGARQAVRPEVRAHPSQPGSDASLRRASRPGGDGAEHGSGEQRLLPRSHGACLPGLSARGRQGERRSVPGERQALRRVVSPRKWSEEAANR